MTSMVWALCSMLVFFLILAFLPLGLTIKGKLFLAVTSFLFALGGLAAVVSFPLWQTALMLVALVFFAAYFFEKRLGTVVFKDTPVFEEKWTDELINPVLNSKLDLSQSDTSFELTELRQTEESLVLNSTPLVSSSQVSEQGQQRNSLPEEDISFLLERDIEKSVDEQQELDEPKVEVTYLSDIESLLDDQLVEKKELEKRDWLEELDNLMPLDEVAAAHEVVEEDKKVPLQK
ncbi:hypothetical protein [Neobacillus sp. PS2-9]|uniref:hypothetical protein n=1 Tax=Neobacillus sp. PS2-9 TaxID=3070676 RepID=UPI0027DF8B63|nr:hypothetical protein [Neobacillus sp. PS2-9]WML59566.1 hypothetical protein RCG25_07295 [Neobacillus sp. PS2-9]